MRSKRKGFCFLELLVIAAIASVLLALTLPSIVNAQEEARQAQCKNNLKQFGLAMHNYHDVFRTLPPAWVAQKPDADEGLFMGWGAFLLPFVDQAPLYNSLKFDDVPKNDPKILRTVLPIYRCPSDPMADLNPIRGNWATSSYSGNSGNERLPGSDDTPAKTNGIMYRNSKIGFRNITDGTSNTFMLGERGLRSASGIWLGVTKNRNENDAMTDCSHQARLNRHITSFSSLHPNGAHFLMCDGSVRMIDNEIDSKQKLGTYQKLSQRDDGEAIGDF